MKVEIPVMFCFDNNYVIPAAVAFYSMLENSNKEFNYKLYVLHSDITLDHQGKLNETIKKFSDFSSLEFIDMSNRFDDLWQQIKTKGHFSKEVMYKVLVASIFPQYDKIIVSDVDVVFLNDISKSYTDFEVKEDYYLAGVQAVGKIMHYMDNYSPVFSDEEIKKLSAFCGGYIVFNLKKLREDKMEEKFIECFKKDGYRINQMEQDVLNLCCYPKTKKLHLKYVACSYIWDYYREDSDFDNDQNYSRKELEESMKNTVQLHYATSIKPWKNPDCTKADEWFKYIVKTPLLNDYLKNLSNNLYISKRKAEKQDLISVNKKGLMYRLLRYIKRNPLFLFDSGFYKKILKKLQVKFYVLKRDRIFYIFDDVFPCSLSPFRYEEYMSYFNYFKHVNCLTTGFSLSALNEKNSVVKVIEDFTNQYPKFKKNFYVLPFKNEVYLQSFFDNMNIYKKRLAIITFVNNMQTKDIDNITFLNDAKIPFIFTLYPGGGFDMNDNVCIKKLKRIFSSNMFRKVVVTQHITKKFLLENNFCKEEDICFIPGVVTPRELLNINISQKIHYGGNDKSNLDICFVAHKCTRNGADKGYDKFIGVAKKLSKKYSNIYFHVVGSFDEKVIDITEIKDRIKFYGIRKTEWFKDFYKDKDIIISANIPYVLGKGGFDGFPTGSCTEAMLNEVALFATDELSQNIFFKDGEDFVKIKPSISDIYKKIIYYYDNPKKLAKLAKEGYKIVNEKYSTSNQVEKRIRLIESQFEKEK